MLFDITLVAIESSYFSVCQHVPVQISNLSASVVALTAFVRHLPHVRPHLYLKTWCVYAREALVTFVCLLTSMCHLVFLQLMYVLVMPHICHGSHGYTHVNFFRPVKFFTDLTRKIGIFDRFYAKSGVFFTDLMRKISVFRCKFYSAKFLPV